MLEENGRLEITPVADTEGMHFNGYVSSSAWDMTGAHARVEVIQTTNGPANTIFILASDSDNWYRFVLESDTLYFQYKAGGPISSTSIPYNPVQHRFWRLRHDAANDLMLWETSLNGESWAIQRKVTPKAPITNLYVALNAGTYKAVSEPGTAVFDNLKLVVHR